MRGTVPENLTPQRLVATALKAARSASGLSISEVARRAGVAKSTLSNLEAGVGNPNLETLWSLATALEVPFSALVDTPTSVPIQVIRAADGPRIVASDADYETTLLSASPPAARRDIYRISAEPGAPRRSQPHHAGTVEHVVVSTGRAKVGPVEQTAILGAGDYMSYAGDVIHVFEALEPATTAILISELRATM